MPKDKQFVKKAALIGILPSDRFILHSILLFYDLVFVIGVEIRAFVGAALHEAIELVLIEVHKALVLVVFFVIVIISAVVAN